MAIAFKHSRIVTILAVLGLFLVTAVSAFAANPHFVRAGATLNADGTLAVSFKEAGLGDNQLIEYLASADGSATYACLNGGGWNPNANNKQEVNGPVTAGGTFSSGKNGQIDESLTLSPPGPGSFSCPPGQTMVLAEVSYTNVAITDLTNGVTRTIPGTFSLVLVDLEGL